jgi:hypothetical protein
MTCLSHEVAGGRCREIKVASSERGGAIRSEGRRLREVVADVRALGGDRILQLNHPRGLPGEDGMAQGAVVHARANGNTTRVAVFGSLGSGALVRFSVPDVNVAAQFSAQVAEASDRSSALRASVTGYQITISP